MGHEDRSDLFFEERDVLGRQFLLLGNGNRPAKKCRDKTEGDGCLGHPEFDAGDERVESTISLRQIR